MNITIKQKLLHNINGMNPAMLTYVYNFTEQLQKVKTIKPDFQSELMEFISNRLINSDNYIEKSINHIFGAWDNEETAEELIDKIRTSRVFNRKIEEL